MSIEDGVSTTVDETVVLKKFNGESEAPEDEFERVVIQNGTVVSHEVIENGEPVGQVPDSELVGKDIGRLTEAGQEGG